MEKKGHLMVAKKLRDIYPRYHFALSLGSIAPDLLFFTYISGHTYEAAFQKVIRMIDRLEDSGKENICSTFMLGYILHYVEDFFTYPHNECFQEGLKGHIAYEREQAQVIMDDYAAITYKNEFALDMETYLKKKHSEYLQEEMNIKNDEKYIFLAAECVTRYFKYVFGMNEMNQEKEAAKVLVLYK